MRAAMTGRPGVWWLECRKERVAFYERLGYTTVPEPTSHRRCGPRSANTHRGDQLFMARVVAAGYAGSE